MTVSKVYNGATWDTGLMKSYTGTVWTTFPAYYDGSFWEPLYPASGVIETVTLSGTTGTPNTTLTVKLSPTDATAGWDFNSDGTVDNEATAGISQFNGGVEWIDLSPTGSYWIRATLNAGNAPDSGTLGTWLALTISRSWRWTITGTGTTSGSVKIEIATDSGGSTIVATGYYGATATVEP